MNFSAKVDIYLAGKRDEREKEGGEEGVRESERVKGGREGEEGERKGEENKVLQKDKRERKERISIQ